MLILLKKEKNRKILNYILLIITPFLFLFILNYGIILINKFKWLDFINLKKNVIVVNIIIEIISFLLVPIYFMKILGMSYSNFFRKINLKLLMIIIFGMFFLTNIGSILTQIISKLFFHNKVISKEYITGITGLFKSNAYIAIFSTMFVAPIIEEFFFRGVLSLSNSFLQERIYVVFFPLFSAIMFAIAHFDFVRIPYLFTIGFSFAYIFMKTKNLWYTMLSHLIINSFASFALIYLIYLKKSNINLDSIIYSNNKSMSFTSSLVVLLISLVINVIILYYIFILFKKNCDDY